MPGILALELSSDPSWVALQVDAGGGAGAPVHERSFAGERGRFLLPEVDALLTGAGLEPRDVGCVLVGTGPGSYTGLRIACSAARALAFALGIRAYGLPSFAAAALAAGPGQEVDLLADAYRGEVYHARYRRTASGVEELRAPRVLSREDARSAVPDGGLLIGEPGLCAGRPRVLAESIRPRASDLIRLLHGITRSDPRGELPLPPPVPLYLRAAARRAAKKTQRAPHLRSAPES